MREILKNLLDSFHNEPGGWSARKLSAFTGICVAIYSTVRYVTSGNLSEILTVWLLFALLCLGIITIEQIIKFKNGKE